MLSTFLSSLSLFFFDFLESLGLSPTELDGEDLSETSFIVDWRVWQNWSMRTESRIVKKFNSWSLTSSRSFVCLHYSIHLKKRVSRAKQNFVTKRLSRLCADSRTIKWLLTLSINAMRKWKAKEDSVKKKVHKCAKFFS